MRSLICDRPGALAVGDRPCPSPGPGEVLVRIRRAGVCGTDLHIFEGTHPFLQYPRVIGHELSGEVAEAGAGCSIAVGRQVYVVPYLHCGACVACRRGKTNCCQAIKVLGVHIDGGMAEFVCVPERNVAPADGVTLDQAAMVEFFAIGAHAVRRGDPKAGDRVLVVGAGPIGLGCVVFAGLRGAAVTVMDSRQDRLDFARPLSGVAQTVLAGPGARGELARLTSGDFYDVVFDATGNAQAMMAGLDYVAHGGVYVLVSVVLDSIAFPDPEFHKRETTLLGSRNATLEDFDAVIGAMRRGQIPTDAFVTHRAPLDEAPMRFSQWLKPESRVIKALIEI